MSTHQATKNPLLRGVSPTPSKIPVRSQRRPPLLTVKPCALDQENQDPRRLVQKLGVQRPFQDSAGLRPEATSQTEKSEKLVGSIQLRNPLEELRPSPRGQNVGPRFPPQTEASGAIEFVADPAALATILSGEGVKSCCLGRQPSLAQRVVVRGTQGGSIQRGQGARASAYLAPRTPTHQLDPARASCFSRLEGPGPRGQTLCPQRLEALIPSSGPSFHPSARPSFQKLRRDTGGSSRTAVSQVSGVLLEIPVQPASSLPEERGIVTGSDEGRGGPLGLAQRVPLRETREITHSRGSCDSLLRPSPGRVVPPSITHPSPFGRAQRVPSPGPSAPTSYSVLKRLAFCPKTQFTPYLSAPGVQQARQLSGLSPQSCPEEPAPPWEQIAVRLFDQESCVSLQEGPSKPPVVTHYGSHPRSTSSLQELKMQRISILQQLLRQESTLGCQSPTFQRSVGKHSPALQQSQGPQSPAIGGSLRYQSPPPRNCPRVEPGASEACSLEPKSSESNPQPSCNQWAPAATSLISSQRLLCASPPICSRQSLRPPTGQTGPSNLAPRTMALRQRLNACLMAIHCFHEACLDDECAFYTSRAPPSGPTRVCSNPVATLLEWQDALCFIPVDSAAPQDTLS
ncbi:tastin isoform X2 [Manis javanica]|uniref:tastin isoform X2 n=1 Tax=Manis javanica TaxID=9974 RepID=UPI003C6DB316